ncbi:hypothetical protein MKK63_26300 [Methylobacterium sp. J-088]|uniref:hypothetical protein n=1 Tax=Methylobacterium sp. J-088 TaxID=2836664 RepID=UPI001FB956DE|nr:hypothetical protein [Methylobacterium sp. J-088]MCJ2066184.1 hypothetical protein [Methylobacterium sp. J-088]
MRIAARSIGRPKLLAWPTDTVQDRNLKLFTATNTCLFALMAVIAVWAAWQRGPWLDEFWTLWLSKHDVPLTAAVRERWLIDVHPPFFTGVNWLVQTWAGDSVLLRRLMNFLPLVASLLLATALCRRYPKNRSYIIICAFMIVTSPVFSYNMTEIRSYFTQICCMTSLIICLYAMMTLTRDALIRDHRLLAASLFLLILLALNIHYVTTVVAASIVAASGLCMLVRRQWKWFFLLLVAGLVASLPLMAWFITQTAFLDQISGTFWIKVSFPIAVKTLIAQIVKSFGFNLAVLVSLAILVTNLLQMHRTGGVTADRVRSEIDPPGVGTGHTLFVIAMVAGLAFATVLLLAVNIKHPHLFVARYLSSIALTTVAIVAALIVNVVRQRRLLFTLLLLNGALVYGITVISHALDRGWDSAASLIQAQKTQCASSQVFAAEYPANYVVPNQDQVIDWAYHVEAARYGFPVQVLTSRAPLDLSQGERCPAILWIDHIDWSELPEPVTLGAITKRLPVALPPKFLDSAHMLKTGSGIVIVGGASAPAQ